MAGGGGVPKPQEHLLSPGLQTCSGEGAVIARGLLDKGAHLSLESKTGLPRETTLDLCGPHTWHHNWKETLSNRLPT